jgi:hypothetical protein
VVRLRIDLDSGRHLRRVESFPSTSSFVRLLRVIVRRDGDANARLDLLRSSPPPYNRKNVLVVGLGPAGFALAHSLVNGTFGVVGIDGLKIEPLPDGLVMTATEARRPGAQPERELPPTR